MTITRPADCEAAVSPRPSQLVPRRPNQSPSFAVRSLLANALPHPGDGGCPSCPEANPRARHVPPLAGPTLLGVTQPLPSPCANCTPNKPNASSTPSASYHEKRVCKYAGGLPDPLPEILRPTVSPRRIRNSPRHPCCPRPSTWPPEGKGTGDASDL